MGISKARSETEMQFSIVSRQVIPNWVDTNDVPNWTKGTIYLETASKKTKAKLLIVGRDQHFQSTISAIFCDWTRNNHYSNQYAIFPSNDLKDALNIFNTVHPDLVIIADNLVDGGDLCDFIRSSEEARHTGIIFFETEEKGKSSVEALELGADDYITRNKEPRETLARASAVIRLKKMTDELRSANHKLEVLSYTDDLTGLYNMRFLQNFIQDAALKCRIYQESYSIVMIDLDNFKSINDTTNHLIGSFIISEVGKLLRLTSIFGKNACIARYGGDEYIAVVPTKDIKSIENMANNFRDLIKKATFQKDGFELKITSSIGVCYVEPGFSGDPNNAIICADLMLYKSKGQGRDQVNSLTLGDSVDFNHICRTHLIDRDPSGKNNNISRFNNIKILK